MTDAGGHTPDVGSSEAGQEGRDRQPTKPHNVEKVEKQSRDAGKKVVHERKDMVHPGPGREEGEKSHGGAHHDGREEQPDMGKEVEEL